MLKNLDLLDALLPGEHYRFLTAFRAFDAVVTACFGYDLDPFYMRYLKEFENETKKKKELDGSANTDISKIACVVRTLARGVGAHRCLNYDCILIYLLARIKCVFLVKTNSAFVPVGRVNCVNTYL